MRDFKEFKKNWKYPEIVHGIPTKYNWIVYHPDKLQLEHGVDIGAFTVIHAGAGVFIGENTQIGPHCVILSVSTIGKKEGEIFIGRNCCIGVHTIIMPNVYIGENSIIGAGSYIDRNIPANTKVIPNQPLSLTYVKT